MNLPEKRIANFPVVIMGTDYWDEILPFIGKMAKAGMIAPSDLELVHATNSVDDAIAHIRSHAIERFGLHVSDERGGIRVGWENAVCRRLSQHGAIEPPSRRTEDLHRGRHSARSQNEVTR